MISRATLPREIIWEIIRHAWSSTMMPSQRSTLFTSSVLVNSHWMAMFIRIACADIHIESRPFMEYYFALLRGDSILLKFTDSCHSLSELCRALTVSIANHDLPSKPRIFEPDREKLLSDCLYRIKLLKALPNLKTLRIHFQNVPCEDVFQYHRFVDFPVQVENLCLEYVFTVPCIPRWMIETPHFSATCNPSWILPSVRHLRIAGGFEDLMKLVFICPKIESLEVDSCLFWDRVSKSVIRDADLIRTRFLRDVPKQYEALREELARAGQKVFIFTENPIKADDGSFNYTWWLSPDFSLGDITDYVNVQYISCTQ